MGSCALIRPTYGVSTGIIGIITAYVEIDRQTPPRQYGTSAEITMTHRRLKIRGKRMRWALQFQNGVALQNRGGMYLHLARLEYWRLVCTVGWFSSWPCVVCIAQGEVGFSSPSGLISFG